MFASVLRPEIRQSSFNNQKSSDLYTSISNPMPNNSTEEKLKQFERLLTIMDELREKCPWDMKQTLQSLRHLTIEEVYELADAILDDDLPEIRNELGDILLHIVFYAKIGDEKGSFDIADVIDAVCEKLIQRHPHIYGDSENSGQVVVVADEEEVKRNWEQLKLKDGRTSVLEGVPKSLPAMVKATRIQEKARGVGFDWDNQEQVWDKVQEELGEFKEEVDSGLSKKKIEQEFGDVLFSMINYARFIGVDPESALERTNKKFISRFQFMEEGVKTDKKKMSDMTLEEMDEYWDKAKEKFA
jgi:XTP/dITP diphosphohydrolase